MDDVRTFPASWDWRVGLITSIAGAILAIVAAAALAAAAEKGTPTAASVGLISALVLIVAWLIAPAQYTVTPAELIVRTHGPALRFSRSQIVDAKPIARRDFGLALRFGSGGLFGVYGVFWSAKIGFFHCWCTRLDSKVIVRRRNGWPLVISPDSRDEFLRLLAESA